LDEEERNSLSGDQEFEDSQPEVASVDASGEDAAQLAAEAAVLAPVDGSASVPAPMALPVDTAPPEPTGARIDRPNGQAGEEPRKDEI
jgi:hypothetical protein